MAALPHSLTAAKSRGTAHSAQRSPLRATFVPMSSSQVKPKISGNSVPAVLWM